MKTVVTRTKFIASSLVVAAVIGGAAYYLIDRQVVTDLMGGAE
ncbi:hypothetical protein [Pseudomonas sp. AMR01]